jgi:hypothetical protein
MQYLRARWYDPETGQFLTRDPLEGITRRPYAYGEDNSIHIFALLAKLLQALGHRRSRRTSAEGRDR